MKTRLFLFAFISIFVFGVKAEELEFPESVTLKAEQPAYSNEGDNIHVFELRDEDKDGVYTANLSLGDRRGSLYLFVDATDKEGNITNWSHTGLRMPFLYGDIPYEVDLEHNNIDNGAASFENWLGGEMRINLKWDNYVNGVHHPLLTVVAPGQPEFGVFPDKLYLIGDFNNFGLPDSSGNNGAIELPHTPGARTFRYEGCVNVEAGKGDFLIYAPEYGKSMEHIWGCIYPHSFTLYKPSGASEAYFTETAELLQPSTGAWIPKDNHIKIKDWVGGEITILVDFENAYYIKVSSSVAPELEIPSTAGSFIRINDVTESEQGLFISYTGKITNGETWLSLTGDETPTRDESWGSPVDEIIDLTTNSNYPHRQWRVPIVKGGYPFKFTCGNAECSSLSLYYNIYNGYANISPGLHGESAVKTVESQADYKLERGSIIFDNPSEIAVYSVAGVCVSHCYSDRFNLNELPKGLYIVTANGKSIKVMI